MKFGIQGQLTDVITCVKFLDDRFRGYGVLRPPKLSFPIDLLRRPYNSVALPCDTVITYFPREWGACHKRPITAKRGPLTMSAGPESKTGVWVG